MKITDSHIHCRHSFDGSESPEDIIRTAVALGAEYIAFTDHMDLDYDYCPTWINRYGKFPQLEVEKHFNELLPLKHKYEGQIEIAIGAELGYLKECDADYRAVTDKYAFDVIINSIHSRGYKDIYFPEYFDGRTKEDAYGDYLKAVRESLDAEYPFNIIGHIGYIERRAPYADTRIRYGDFADIIDDILKTIVIKGVALEVNTQTKGMKYDFIPDFDIIKRYRELGGELISYGSDAHLCERIGEKFLLVTEMLKAAGFGYVASFMGGKPRMHKIV